MEIQYWIRPHEHPLRVREDAINDQFTCQICDNSRSESGAPFYVCDSCNGFHAHKSCTELPNKIQHPFHPHSPLTLKPKKSASCDSCHRDFKDAPFYSCDSADNFHMDVECALMPLAIPSRSSEDRDWIRHFGHPHLLLRVDDQQIKCFGCNNQAFYGCSKCDYFLDKSCVELPHQVYIPVNHSHREAFVLLVTSPFRCDMCRIRTGDRHNFRFVCSECNSWICFKCAKITSSRNIEYEDHQHPLSLVENVNDIASLLSQCNGYDSYCSQSVVASSNEFRKAESPMLWCFYCDFKVHFLCAPLPSVIKHELHIHSLVLVDSLAEDDYREYYCDVCETRRDPRIRLYCCQDCKYFAHIHCVIPETVKLMSEDLRGSVEFKTVGQDIWNVSGRDLKIECVDPALILKDVINDLSEDEKDKLRIYYDWDESSSKDQKKEKQEDHFNAEISYSFKVGDEEIEEILQLSHFTDGSFRNFWYNLRDFYYKNKVELKSRDLGRKIVKVRGYMIPHFLAPVLNTLLCEIGDIGSGSSESLGMKSFVFFTVCKVVKRMHSTMPKCVTKNLLQEWYFHLAFARERGFKVTFARKQLEELVHAFLGFQAQRIKHEIPTILTNKIADLQRKLDECNQICRSSSKSEYEDYCLNMAFEFEWKQNAFGDSLTQSRSTEASQWIDGVDTWSD